MANLTAATAHLNYPKGGTRSFVVKNATTLYAGSLVGIDADGFLDSWANTSGMRFVGLLTQTVVGDTSATPPVEGIVDVSGVTLKNVAIAGTFVQADVNARVCCSTNNPADITKSFTSSVNAIGWASRFRAAGFGDVTLYTPEQYDAIAGRSALTAGTYCLTIPVVLATVANGDVATAIVIPHNFRIVRFDALVTTVVTTGGDAATLNIEIGSTNLTGGTIALTSANCTPLGAVVAGASITGANTGNAGDNISVEAASVTAFAEGAVMLAIWIQNLDY